MITASQLPVPESRGPLISLRRLIADGRHNAFTGLLHHKGIWHLNWRTSSGHGQADGDIRMLRSVDAVQWEETQSPFCKDRNFMEGHMVSFGGKIFMYSGTFDRDTPLARESMREYATCSEDGLTWSTPQVSYKDRWRFWNPRVIGDALYVCAYTVDRSNLQIDGRIPGGAWQVDLLRSKDGFSWDKVAVVSTGEGGNETELYAEDDGKLRAFVRCAVEPDHLIERRSPPPYTDWSERIDCGRNIQGQIVQKIHGRLFMIGRERPADQRNGTIFARRDWIRTKIWVEENGFWVDYCTLPSAFDCSYAGMAALGPDRMLVSYYSQHLQADNPDFEDMNGGSDIFLAEVRTDAPAELGTMVKIGREQWK